MQAHNSNENTNETAEGLLKALAKLEKDYKSRAPNPISETLLSKMEDFKKDEKNDYEKEQFFKELEHEMYPFLEEFQQFKKNLTEEKKENPAAPISKYKYDFDQFVKKVLTSKQKSSDKLEIIKENLMKVRKEVYAKKSELENTNDLNDADLQNLEEIKKLNNDMMDTLLEIYQYQKTNTGLEYNLEYNKTLANYQIINEQLVERAISLLKNKEEKRKEQEAEKNKEEEKKKEKSDATDNNYLESLNDLIDKASNAQNRYETAIASLANKTSKFYIDLYQYNNEILEAIIDLKYLLNNKDDKKSDESKTETINAKKEIVTKIEANTEKLIKVIDQLPSHKQEKLQSLSKLNEEVTAGLQKSIDLIKQVQNPKNQSEQELQNELTNLQTSIQNTKNNLNELRSDVENDNIVLIENGVVTNVEPDNVFNERLQTQTNNLQAHTKNLTEIENRLKTLLTKNETPADKTKKFQFKPRIYSDSEQPSEEQEAGVSYLSSEEKRQVKEKTKRYLDMIQHIERNYKYAKDARNPDEFKKMQAQCIYMVEVLTAYKNYLNLKNNYAVESENYKIIEDCLYRLTNNNTSHPNAYNGNKASLGLLADDSKLGPSAQLTGKISTLSLDVCTSNNQKDIEDWLATLKVNIENIVTNNAGDSTFTLVEDTNTSYHTSDNFTTRYTHMSTGDDANGTATHYVTLQTQEAGKRVAKFYMDNTQTEAQIYKDGKHGTTFFSKFIKTSSNSIPNDRILVWAITQVEDFLQDNPDSNSVLRLTGSLGNFTADHVQALMLYVDYKREIEGVNVTIENETSAKRIVTHNQVQALVNRLKNADTETGPFKNLKGVVNKLKKLSADDTLKNLQKNTNAPVPPVPTTKSQG